MNCELFSFKLNNIDYAIPLQQIKATKYSKNETGLTVNWGITKAPFLKPPIIGLYSFSRSIIPVIDIAQCLSIAPVKPNGLIVVSIEDNYNNYLLAFFADQLGQTVRLGDSQWQAVIKQPLNKAMTAIEYVFKAQRRRLILLELGQTSIPFEKFMPTH